MKGRKPIPTALKLIRGNPGRRSINQAEPKPTPATSEPPPALQAEAKQIWEAMAAELCRLTLLTEIDRHHLARACMLEALGMKLLRKAVRKPVDETRSNGRQPTGEFMAALRAFESADRVWMRFGITPAERTRIKVGPPEEEDAFQSFMRRKNRV